jgi:hypothetical protein
MRHCYLPTILVDLQLSFQIVVVIIMSKPMNYDKWRKIEVSDDEDDTHPNIDTPSLFRWRHQARIERREQRMQDQDEHEKQRQG